MGLAINNVYARPQKFETTKPPEQAGFFDTANSILYKPNFPDTIDFHSSIKPLAQKIPKTIKNLNFNFNVCSCVSYVKSITGVTQSIGAAKNWPKNSQIPQVGEVVITRESRSGHVAIIVGIIDNNLILNESNYSSCQFTSGRKLAITSPLILGYWNAYTEIPNDNNH